jgi:hypothetical protein
LVTMADAFYTMVQGSYRRCGRFAFDGVAAIRNRVHIHYLAARLLGDHGG